MADYSQMFANPWLQMGLGILGANRPGASFGEAVGQGGLLGIQNYQAQLKYQQEQDELKRMLAAQAKVAEMSPEIGPILQAYPNAAPQVLGSLYKSPSDAPSNVREWQYFSQLPEAEQQQYLTMKRANQWLDQGGYNVMPSPLNPMSPMAILPKSLPPQDLPQVRGAQAQAAAMGGAKGTGQAESESELSGKLSSLPRLRSVVNELSALGKKATYTRAGQARDAAMRQLGMDVGPAAIARKEYIAKVDNEILPLLRETFGPQFTQKEGESLRQTLGDPDATPTEKDAILRAFIKAKEENIQVLQRKAGQRPAQGQAPATAVSPPPGNNQGVAVPVSPKIEALMNKYPGR